MKRIIFPLLLSALVLTACQESLEERCAREAKEFTEKQCPSQIAANMVIDSLVFEPASHTLKYCYTLESVLDNAEQLQQHDLRAMLLKELRNTTQMKLYKDAGYTFRYVYYSKAHPGQMLFETTLKEKDYQ